MLQRVPLRVQLPRLLLLLLLLLLPLLLPQLLLWLCLLRLWSLALVVAQQVYDLWGVGRRPRLLAYATGSGGAGVVEGTARARPAH